MEFLPRFAWAVPTAYLDVLALCQFRRGLRLYDDQAAYTEDWSAFVKQGSRWLQVTAPDVPYAGGQQPDEEESVRAFARNWGTEVRFQLFEGDVRVGDEVITEQGRLYSFIWHGDSSLFDEGEPLPDPPKDVRAMVRAVAAEAKAERIGERFAADPSSRFVLVVDQANPGFRDKMSRLTASVRDHLVRDPRAWFPDELGLGEADTYAPTIQLVEFATELGDEELLAIADEALRSPGAKAMRLSAHGALVGGVSPGGSAS